MKIWRDVFALATRELEQIGRVERWGGGRLALRLSWSDDKTSWQHSLSMFCALCTGFLHRCATMVTPTNKPPKKHCKAKMPKQSAQTKTCSACVWHLHPSKALGIAQGVARGVWQCTACSNANYHCCGGLCALFCYATGCISFSPVFGGVKFFGVEAGASYKLRAMPPFSHSSGKSLLDVVGHYEQIAESVARQLLGDISKLGELGGHIFDAKVLFASPLVADKEGLRDDTCKPAHDCSRWGSHASCQNS